jgi:hypothetical protein
MPQLDQYSLFTQYFWLFSCFLTFYFLILKNFLPKIAQIFKVRASMMDGSGNELEDIILEMTQKKNKGTALEVHTLKESKDILSDTFQKTSNWSSKTMQAVSKESFGPIHQVYISTIGNLSLSQNLSLKQLESLLPPTASVNPALVSFPQREMAFNKALFQNLKARSA